jgi:hypothetical protein
MNIRNLMIPIGILALLALAYRQYGGLGVAAVGGGVVMWLLLHYTRMVNVMAKAAKHPVGYVGSAVMLNTKLAPNVTLLHVIAMTQSLGEAVSQQGVQPEVFRWTDASESTVTCTFTNGRLSHWDLYRPPVTPENADTTEVVPNELPSP